MWEHCGGKGRLLFLVGAEIGSVFEQEKQWEQNTSCVFCCHINLYCYDVL